GPSHGTLSGTAPNLTYTPNANCHGTDSFTFKTNDGTVDSAADGTISITVNSVNDKPTASNASASTNEDSAKAITLTGGDVDGDSLTFTVTSGPSHGTLSGTGANFIYTPNANYNGPDSFTYVANDGWTDSAVASVSLTVNGADIAPTITSNGGDVTA